MLLLRFPNIDSRRGCGQVRPSDSDDLVGKIKMLRRVPRRYVSHLQSIISLFILVHHRLAKLLHRLGRRYAVCACFPPDMADSFPFECAQELPSLRWDLCLLTTIFNRLCMRVGPSWCGIDPSVGLFRVGVVATLKAVSIEISWTSGDEVAARAAGPAGPLHPPETELPMMSTRY
ncbi:hypothetical protein BHM03_00051974 [Ensete ventricosum]|nr:hypothetical protein BHM03_00051974 [Ensete ventricosum]